MAAVTFHSATFNKKPFRVLPSLFFHHMINMMVRQEIDFCCLFCFSYSREEKIYDYTASSLCCGFI